MSMASRLLADIGGTHARLAWQRGRGEPLEHLQVLQCQDHVGLAQAVLDWLAAKQLPVPQCGAIAVACPVQSDKVQLTNNGWSFSIKALQERLGLQRLVVVNDFTALAWALPSISQHHLFQIGAAPQQPFVEHKAVALLGPGTGLGVAGLLPDRWGGWMALSGEGGHVSLAIHDDLQYRIWSILQKHHGHVSAERVLSGQGLVNIHACLQSMASGSWPKQMPTPAQVTALALEQRDPVAVQALGLFARWLGSAAGDLALTLGATGGVFIGGGIAPRMLDFLISSDFRKSFEDKGRFSDYLASMPVWVINCPVSPALHGVASLLD